MRKYLRLNQVKKAIEQQEQLHKKYGNGRRRAKIASLQLTQALIEFEALTGKESTFE